MNIHGELIGINTVMKVGAENIGFAIPVSQVKRVLSTSLLDLDQTIAYLGCDFDAASQRVTSVIPQGPADLAGLAPDDRILEIDGKIINGEESFRLARLAIQPGVPTEIVVDRRGERIETRFPTWNPVDGFLFDRLGITVRSRAWGRSNRYLQIQQIDPSGPAGRIGIQTGDVIAAVKPDGWPSRTFGRDRDLALLVARLQPESAMKIEVFRDDDKDGLLERNDLYSELYTGTLEIR